MSDSWNLLLDKIGIAKTFNDAGQQHKQYVVDDAVLLKMIKSLGYNITDTADSEKLLHKIDNQRWQTALEAIYVVKQENIQFDVVLKESEWESFDFLLLDEDNKPIEVEYTQQILEKRRIGVSEYIKAQLNIITFLPPQYYTICLQNKNKEYRSTLAVTPEKCYIPETLRQQKLWGLAIQLYAVKSLRNWGVGDFSDLKNIVRMAAQYGADVIGLNPLNVLFHDFPENASPYSSISRLFLNPIYIDVEKVAGYKKDVSLEEEIKKARESDDIDYPLVYNLKIKVLKKIFNDFNSQTQPELYAKFKEFCSRQGDDLENLAVYQALYSFWCKKVCGGWRGWPLEFQKPSSVAVREFKHNNDDEIKFFKFLQFIAAYQLKEVYAEVKKQGLKIGLYRDLPVGLCKDSVELWAGNDLFIKDCGAGAPPDVFFPTGQKWCLGAFNPLKLKANAYLPFIKVIRAAMEGAGALRIDHVMSLMRLYIISDDDDTGTYIYYNFEDMLGIVALESYLHKCMVVGESIGNVPDGFIEKIHERGIYSLSVLWAERWSGNGDFKQPKDFPATAFCSVGTHDMAPLKMRWFGYDIETMYQLKMLDDNDRQMQYHGREDERRRLLATLDYNGVWPQDKPRQGDCIYGEEYPHGIMEAVEKYMALSNSDVYLAQPEDIFGMEVMQNLPGTDRDKHPNWRRKLPVPLEKYAENEDWQRAISIIATERRKK